MNFEQEKFLKAIPPDWFQIYSKIKQFGFIPTIVGGCIRDFMTTGKIGVDWDIELNHPKMAFNRSYWKDLGQALSQFGKVSYLPYEVMRLDLNTIQFEFSPPRKEHFFEDWNSHGHSNFEATFDWQMEFDQAVLRRDFTINAIGVRFISESNVEILDPLGGLKHLMAKRLHPCGPDFLKDPVRFLRAFRFRRKLGLEFSHELTEVLKKVPLTKLSGVYFWDELQKSLSPLEMFHDLIHWKIEQNQYLPSIFNDKNWLAHWPEFSSALVDQTGHDYWIVAMEWCQISLNEWQVFFKLNESHSERLQRWVAITKRISLLKPESLHGEFDVFINNEVFNMIFEWYFSTKHLLQKKGTSKILQLVERKLPTWSYLFQFDLPKDVKHIDPPLRSKYQVWNLCQRL